MNERTTIDLQKLRPVVAELRAVVELLKKTGTAYENAPDRDARISKEDLETRFLTVTNELNALIGASLLQWTKDDDGNPIMTEVEAEG